MQRWALPVALAVLIAGCGGAVVSEPPPTTSTTSIAEIPAPPGETDEEPDDVAEVDNRPVYQGFEAGLREHSSLVAMTRGDTEVYAAPGDEVPLVTMPATTILNTVTVLTVVGEPIDGWAEVMLPIRPNGSTGWIRVDDVELYLVQGKIVIDLSDKRLTYSVDGEELITSTIAIGTNQDPTPTGIFFVTDSVTLRNPDSLWGPHALGISARSDTITEFNGGNGIIGIHGTSNPSSIGRAVSLGCIRLPNDLITELHTMVPLGTPVEIQA
ncbi:MAG: murein L,D-transpeptidase [Acidobacteria bacterium]|nr:MAG: murein L,D-transpeptidase [Acidobacteriota bacterium]